MFVKVEADSEKPKASGITSVPDLTRAIATLIEFLVTSGEKAFCSFISSPSGEFAFASMVSCATAILIVLEFSNVPLIKSNFPENEVLLARYSTTAEYDPLRCTDTL